MFSNKSSTKTDDFWDDCQEEKIISLNNLNNSPENIKQNNIYENLNFQLKTTKNSKNSSLKSINSQKTKNNQQNFSSPISEKMYKNLYYKYPEISENIELEKNIDKIKRSKKALLRCYGLYSYGVEIKKNIEYNKEQNDIRKKKDELSLCTFKPKINNKKLNFDENKNNVFLKKYSPKNKKKLVNNSLDKVHETKKEEEEFEVTFKPKIKYNLKPKIVFNNSPKFIKNKENKEFIFRYKKARDENLIKNCNILYRKDDCFKNSLFSLVTRICNEQYKNCLNVNHVLSVFGETIYDKNKKVNASICDFKGLTITEQSPSHHKKRNKNSKSLIVELRKDLQKINLD